MEGNISLIDGISPQTNVVRKEVMLKRHVASVLTALLRLLLLFFLSSSILANARLADDLAHRAFLEDT